MENYNEDEYHQRNLVESAMRFKSKYGGSVKGKLASSIKTEIYLRLIANNLGLRPKRLSTEPLLSTSCRSKGHMSYAETEN